MKKFDQFVSEELDIRRGTGVPEDFTRKAEEEARRNLGIRIDDESQMRVLWPAFSNCMNESNQLLVTDQNGRRLTTERLNQRLDDLQNLAESIVRTEFGELLETSVKPIEFNIKLVPMGAVPSEVRDILDVPVQFELPTKEDQEEQDERDQEERDKKDEEKEEDKETETKEEPIPGTNLISAVNKKKILNMITQAAGKSTKDIIKASDIIDSELEEIFGNTWRRILDLWIQMSDIADKIDWVIPLERRSGNAVMAGACQVKWESFDGSHYSMDLILEKEATKIVITAAGVDFPMLIHESVKGIYLFLQSGAIKKDKKTAEIIKRATSSFFDEAQDFRYGPPALQMLLIFMNKFPESNKHRRLEASVFAMLAVDKERAMTEAEETKREDWKSYLRKKAQMAYTDEQFLEIMKSMFSVFDLVRQGGRMEYVINEERFNSSKAKVEIGKLIKWISSDIEELNREIAEWEMENRGRESFKPSEEQETKSVDYSEMTQRQLTNLIDDALDRGDMEEVKKISKYLKNEGKEIFLRELDRLNESHIIRKRK